MNLSYTEIYKLAQYGRRDNGWIDYPLRLACKKLELKLARWDMDYLESHIRYGHN